MTTPYRSKRRKFSFAKLAKEPKSKYSVTPFKIKRRKSSGGPTRAQKISLLTAMWQNERMKQLESQIGKDDGGLLGHIASPVGSLLGDVKDTVFGLPMGAVALGKAAGSDAKDLISSQSFTGGSDLGRLGRGIAEDYRYRFGDISDALGVSLIDTVMNPGQAKKDLVDNNDWSAFAKKVCTSGTT
jgi:hypothetical protein